MQVVQPAHAGTGSRKSMPTATWLLAGFLMQNTGLAGGCTRKVQDLQGHSLADFKHSRDNCPVGKTAGACPVPVQPSRCPLPVKLSSCPVSPITPCKPFSALCIGKQCMGIRMQAVRPAERLSAPARPIQQMQAPDTGSHQRYRASKSGRKSCQAILGFLRSSFPRPPASKACHRGGRVPRLQAGATPRPARACICPY